MTAGPDFHALRSRHRCPEAVLYAFDLPEHDGADLCDLPLIERKQGPATLLGRVKRQVICFNEHLADDGPTVFKHICRAGLLEVIGRRPLSTARLLAEDGRPNSTANRLHQACAGLRQAVSVLIRLEKWDRRPVGGVEMPTAPADRACVRGERGRPSSTSGGLRSFYSSDGGWFERGAPVRWSCVRSEGREATLALEFRPSSEPGATMQSACSMAARSPPLDITLLRSPMARSGLAR